MFYSGLLNANLDLDVYADRVNAIGAMVGTKVQIGEEKVKIKSCSQAFMSHLRQLLRLDIVDLNVKLFNLSIRSRLLIFLLKPVLDKVSFIFFSEDCPSLVAVKFGEKKTGIDESSEPIFKACMIVYIKCIIVFK
ncbi:hypothetical protein BpHYR1_018599 [Brachionus plicatilis]|uniref:Uncharacterized protein n=1 Tax=Brachionus plicatilis TaxID=10195 RepID=A0A3M7R9N8_BRAPC|nr:hypothetical protein BpHYR1_018599 [Brachionus plicatilis]